MYQNTQLGNFADTLKKVRKVVHSIFPRELSPSRMLEKYASDTKKKAAKTINAATDKSAALNLAADSDVSKRIATLQLQTLPITTDQPTFETNVPAPAKPKAETDYTPYLWLGAFALAGALYVIRRRR
jgi:lipoprotein-anchoring transpeptidase ErfK/SrfK